MPGLDRTGPLGKGPMTGRRLGNCAGNYSPGNFENFGFGIGYRWGNRGGAGRGRGFGRGFGFSGNRNLIKLSDKEIIENEINILKEQLSFLEKKLSSLNEKE
ncbi:MAG: DUF5320 domain-containing protein [Bacteroidales bacterium]|nr:DUF5320 domain-containing protein [Bacteroidales bacterium]